VRRYVLRRLAVGVLQALGITIAVFFVIRTFAPLISLTIENCYERFLDLKIEETYAVIWVPRDT